MNLIINSNKARRLPFLSKKPLPTNEVIGPFPAELKSNLAFRAARDRGLITVTRSPVIGRRAEAAKPPPPEVIPEVVKAPPPVEDPVDTQLEALKALSEKTVAEVKVALLGGDIDMQAFKEVEEANKKRVSLLSFIDQF